MGKASITISVGALWNGGPELKKVNSDLKTMAARVAALDKSTTQGLALSGQHVENLGNKIYDMGTKIEGVGRSLTNNITVPMSAVGGYCVNQATDFDTSLANLNKTADLTRDQLKALGDAALDASTTSPVTAAQIVNAEALGAQLGITTDNLKSFSDVANGLDIATNMDMETAATEMAQFANITSMGQDKLSNYGSTIVDLGNHLATTESDISHMSLRLAGMTTTANFTQAEILGMAGAMSSLGIKAEAGGSAMTQIVANITKEVASGSDAVEEYARVSGMSADEFSAKWQSSPMEALEAIIDGINRLSNEGQETDVTLSQLGITSIRQADVMRRLSGNTDVLHEAIGRANSAWQDNTALTEEVDKRNESLESRFQTLKNKADAAAIKIGGPLAEALLDVADDLSPLIDGIADACQAFADMDSGTQGTILALAGVAAAAGPVLTVTGKITQGVGNVITAFGKTQTQAAIFGDALNTVDGASMRVYASTDSMATKLGIAGNAAAKAAGGAENYVSAWERMNDAAKVAAVSQEKCTAALDKACNTSGKTSEKALELAESYEYQRNAALKAYEDNAKLVSTYSGSTKEAEKAATAAEKATKSFSAEGKGCDVLRNSLDRVKTGTDYAAGQTEALNKAMENSKKSAKTLGDRMSSLGGTAKSYAKNVGSFFAEFAKANAAAIAITVLTAAVAAVASSVQEAEERNRRFSEATDGLVAAANGATNEIQNQSSALDVLSGSSSNAKDAVDKVLESQANLAQFMRDTNTNAAAQSSQLTDAYNTIKEYANHSDLTTDAQGKLRSAIETVNDQCGTQISVTDIANGKLADENGAISDVTEALGKYVEKKLEQIKIDAQQQNLTALYQQKQNDIEALTKAQKDYNERLGDHDQFVESYIRSSGKYCQNARESAEAAWEGHKAEVAAASGLNDAQSALDACNSSIDNVNASLGASVSAADGASQSVGNLTLASSTVTSAINAVGGDINQFASDLANTGISVSQFKSLNDEQLSGLVAAWDGTTDSLVAALDGMNIQMNDKGAAAANALASGLSTGKVSAEAATEMLKAAASGDWSGVVAQMKSNGINIPDAVADGVTANDFAPSEATSQMLSLVALKLTGGDVDAAAQLCGGNIDAGLAEAINNGTVSEEAAAYLGQDVIDKLNEGAGCHSPSVKAAETGMYVDQGLANGISENQQGPLDAVSNLATSVINGLSTLANDFLNQGTSASSGLASGLSSNAGAVSSASSTLSSNAVSGVSTTASTLGNTGFTAGSNFASKLGSMAGSAASSARSIAASTASGVSGAPGTLGNTGQSAGNRFASGVGRATSSSRTSGKSLSDAAKGGAESWNPSASGSHLGNQFARGIGSAWNAVRNKALELVNAAKSVMGFSVPDDGPWSGSERGGETSGRHLGENFARGMALAVPTVRKSALDLAAAANPTAALGAFNSVPSLAGVPSVSGSGQTVQVTNNNVYINGAKVNNLSAHAQELIGELFGEVGVVAGMGY